MKTKLKLYTAVAVAALSLSSVANNSFAVEKDIGAKAKFRKALSLTNSVSIDYGTIEYSAAAANNIAIATSGAVSCSNSADYSCPSTGTAGSLDLAGTTGAAVQVSCETAGVITDGTNPLNVTTTKVKFAGTEASCAGLGTPARTANLSAGANPILVGATLEIPSSGVPADGQYDSANAGGDPISVKVMYQ